MRRILRSLFFSHISILPIFYEYQRSFGVCHCFDSSFCCCPVVGFDVLGRDFAVGSTILIILMCIPVSFSHIWASALNNCISCSLYFSQSLRHKLIEPLLRLRDTSSDIATVSLASNCLVALGLEGNYFFIFVKICYNRNASSVVWCEQNCVLHALEIKYTSHHL